MEQTNAFPSARRAAYSILVKVAGGGYASDLLLEETAGLASRDAGLASQLVYGCLRYQGQLDFLIRHYSGRDATQMEEPVRILLRLGLFQLRYLDRIPAHAAVHETVELAKRHRRSAAGLLNAVLRKVRRNPVRWPDKATELSCPGWLLERWTRQFGNRQAEQMAKAALEEPARYIRLRPGESPPEGLTLAETDVAGCFRVTGGDYKNLRLQDIGSQAIIPLLGLHQGQSYLDLCAAPGNKTRQALEVGIRAVACDVSSRRLRQVPAICPRVVLDATRPLPFRQRFDRILIDAPCSGTGTIGRNPEIKWRVQPQDLIRLQEKQVDILKCGLEQLVPGGVLVYATCSLEIEENEEVVRRALDEKQEVRLVREIRRLPGREPGDGFYAAVLTSGNSAIPGQELVCADAETGDAPLRP